MHKVCAHFADLVHLWQLLSESKAFGKLTRYRSFVPPYCLLRHRYAITRIQQATPLFPGRGGHVSSDLLSFADANPKLAKWLCRQNAARQHSTPFLRGWPFPNSAPSGASGSRVREFVLIAG